MLTLERRQTAGIATAAVTRRALEGTSRWPAVVEVQEGARAEVRARAQAFVERLAVRESGVRVRAGQTLLWMYSPELLRAQEDLLTAHRWSTSPEGAPPGLEAAEAAARQRLLLYGATQRDVEALLAAGQPSRTLALRAPISGYVTRLEAVVGTYAQPDTLLYEVTDLSRVRVVATAPRDELPEPGQLDARFERRSGAAISLRLELVEPALTEATRSIRVRFAADNPELALRPGDIGEVVVLGPARDALVVPRDALIDTGRLQYVFVERERGLFEPREVRPGPLHGEEREILSGLAEREIVVSRGAFVLDSESRLQAALSPLRPDAGRSAHHRGAP